MTSSPTQGTAADGARKLESCTQRQADANLQKLTRQQPEQPERRQSDRPEVQVGPETMHSAPPGRSKSSLESSLSAAVRPGGTGFNLSWAETWAAGGQGPRRPWRPASQSVTVTAPAVPSYPGHWAWGRGRIRSTKCQVYSSSHDDSGGRALPSMPCRPGREKFLFSELVQAKSSARLSNFNLPR